MEFEIHNLTCKGLSHQQNEDCYISNGDLVVVADGMGGESEGDVASKLAVETINQVVTEKLSSIQDDGVCQLLFDAIHEADKAILDHISANPDSFGMGTTAIVALLKNGKMNIAWCGDSRCYVFNQANGVKSLTKDHSYVQQLIDSGELTIEQSFSHPDNNLITRYIGGGDDTCQPEFMTYEMLHDDMLIVCSDGLSGYCTESDIDVVVRKTDNIESLPNNLAQLALSRGSDDDITIVVLANSQIFQTKNSMIRRLKKLFTK